MPSCTDICTTTVSIDYDVSHATEHRSSFTFALHDTALPTVGARLLVLISLFMPDSTYLYEENIEKYSYSSFSRLNMNDFNYFFREIVRKSVYRGKHRL